jgi:hypothetical protein
MLEFVFYWLEGWMRLFGGARRAAWFATTKALVSPPRSVIFDAELCEHAGRQPGSFTLASHSKLNDLLPDQLCHAISQADGELKFGAHGFKRLVHDTDLLGLESDSSGSESLHRGAA